MGKRQARINALRQDVEALCRHTRPVGSHGHDEAQSWLVRRVEALGLAGYHGRHLWPYEAGEQGERVIGGFPVVDSFANVLARVPGRDSALEPILLGAHYDTCGHQPGADDNAAAIAIVLDVAAALQRAPLERDVILAFFDGEEPPHFLTERMGSIRFYEDQRREQIHFAVILDLCGHDVPIPGREDLLFITGMESDPGLESLVQEGNGIAGLRTVAVLNRYVQDLSDHHAFRLDGRPYLFLSCGRWEHYHMPTDTPEKLNYEKMSLIADYVLHAATAADTRALGGQQHDPASTEAALIREHMGVFLDALDIQVQTRADIDGFVPLAMGYLGL